LFTLAVIFIFTHRRLRHAAAHHSLVFDTADPPPLYPAVHIQPVRINDRHMAPRGCGIAIGATAHVAHDGGNLASDKFFCLVFADGTALNLMTVRLASTDVGVKASWFAIDTLWRIV
jgi:hypothetical protein